MFGMATGQTSTEPSKINFGTQTKAPLPLDGPSDAEKSSQLPIGITQIHMSPWA